MKGLTMAYKLLEMAEQRWRALDGASLLPAGARFTNGVLIERTDQGEKAA
jgi:hypothetical protein